MQAGIHNAVDEKAGQEQEGKKSKASIRHRERKAKAAMPVEIEARLSGVRKALSCSICLKVAKNGFVCSECSNLTCRRCLSTWLKKNKPKRCPQCKTISTAKSEGQNFTKFSGLGKLTSELKNLDKSIAEDSLKLWKKTDKLRKQDFERADNYNLKSSQMSPQKQCESKDMQSFDENSLNLTIGEDEEKLLTEDTPEDVPVVVKTDGIYAADQDHDFNYYHFAYDENQNSNEDNFFEECEISPADFHRMNGTENVDTDNRNFGGKKNIWWGDPNNYSKEEKDALWLELYASCQKQMPEDDPVFGSTSHK